jgi:hypothetical protein
MKRDVLARGIFTTNPDVTIGRLEAKGYRLQAASGFRPELSILRATRCGWIGGAIERSQARQRLQPDACSL